MSILCDQCGVGILPLANFCSYCGAEAPRKTVVLNSEQQKSFKNPIFCPACGESSPKDALYCASCGLYLYQLTEKNVLFCPGCKEKNKTNAKICTSCGLSFSDWFSMKGIVAENIGYNGNIILKESMNDISYHFMWNKIISIGRSSENDIVLPIPLVSGQHCKFDNKKQLIIDLKSKNGTYVNRNSQKINNIPLNQIYEFNIAGSFTFTVSRIVNAFIFRLTAILNQEHCQKFGNMQAIDELRKHYYIIPSGDAEFYIRKIDGVIESKINNMEESCQIKILKRYYYFSDLSRNINDHLVLKKYKNIPVNWEISN